MGENVLSASLFYATDTLKKIPEAKINSQLDIVDVYHKTFHLKGKNDSVKYQGMGPFISVLPVLGYALQSGTTGALTTSTSFFTDSKRSKFSNIIANAFYSQYHQYWFNVNSNIFLENRGIHLFGDWRYYKFPTKTYGAGNKTQAVDALDIDYSYFRFYQYVFWKIVDNTFIGLGYNLDNHWNIHTGSTTGDVYNELKTSIVGNRSVSSGFTLNLLFDNRKNSINSDQGSYVNFQYRDNLEKIGSDKNWQSILIEYRHYFKFSGTTKNILAFWSYNHLTFSGQAPYLDRPSIGWDDYTNTGRGYVPGRFMDNNLFYAESEYRFQLLPNGLLGGVVFGNLQSVVSSLKSSLNPIIPGGGIGFRLKLNKFSNTNLSIDYGFGKEGSRGLFFNLGEVF